MPKENCVLCTSPINKRDFSERGNYCKACCIACEKLGKLYPYNKPQEPIAPDILMHRSLSNNIIYKKAKALYTKEKNIYKKNLNTYLLNFIHYKTASETFRNNILQS